MPPPVNLHSSHPLFLCTVSVSQCVFFLTSLYVIIILCHGREFLVDCQDVVFLSSRATFYAAYLRHCGRGEGLMSTTCVRTVVGVSKGMLPVRHLHSNIASCCVSCQFLGDHKTVTLCGVTVWCDSMVSRCGVTVWCHGVV